jgi:hypothetical protein
MVEEGGAATASQDTDSSIVEINTPRPQVERPRNDRSSRLPAMDGVSYRDEDRSQRPVGGIRIMSDELFRQMFQKRFPRASTAPIVDDDGVRS